MPSVDKQIPEKMLSILLQHKKEVLDNITAQYKEEMADANADGERLFKYGFIFAGVLQTVMGGLAVAIPAVIGYNRFADKAVRLEIRYDGFTEEFSKV